MKRKVMFIFGTRPEAIKLAPLIRTFRADAQYETIVCVTAQHRDMLDQVLDFFSIVPDDDLDLMRAGQQLPELTAKVITGVTEKLQKHRPDLVFVQGDTTTVLGAAYAAFCCGVKIAHVEAGLRSHNMQSPFPEEMNRVCTAQLATFHFCPVEAAKQNLYNEGIRAHLVLTGNTVIDALLEADALVSTGDATYGRFFSALDPSRKKVLITCHRRESFGEPLQRIVEAIQLLADRFPDVDFVFPVHPNPNVKDVVHSRLKRGNIRLYEPFPYAELVWIMKRATVILTDSGGIQEEAPTFGKLSIVMREVTERMEGVEAGTSVLVGTDTALIVAKVSEALNEPEPANRLAGIPSPFGDGKAAARIHQYITDYFHAHPVD